MAVAEVQQAMRRLVARLDELEIPYAIVGAMALNEHGYRRVTIDVDVLLTREGLQRPESIRETDSPSPSSFQILRRSRYASMGLH